MTKRRPQYAITLGFRTSRETLRELRELRQRGEVKSDTARRAFMRGLAVLQAEKRAENAPQNQPVPA